MKTCIKCDKEKELSDFNKKTRNADGLQPYCKDCQRSLAKTYYRSNAIKMREQISDAKEARKTIARDYVVDYLKTHPCVDCGVDDIRVLEFDHVRGVKLDGVGRLIAGGYTLKAIQEEIDKCEVRCKNHHAIVTYERLGGSWHDRYLDLPTD